MFCFLTVVSTPLSPSFSSCIFSELSIYYLLVCLLFYSLSPCLYLFLSLSLCVSLYLTSFSFSDSFLLFFFLPFYALLFRPSLYACFFFIFTLFPSFSDMKYRFLFDEFSRGSECFPNAPFFIVSFLFCFSAWISS